MQSQVLYQEIYAVPSGEKRNICSAQVLQKEIHGVQCVARKYTYYNLNWCEIKNKGTILVFKYS